METKTILWIAIGVLAVAVLFLTFKAGATGNVVSSTSSAVKSASSYGGMVGGC